MQNYFEIFNIAQEYYIDLDDLESKYLKLIKTVHPDNFIKNKNLHLAALKKTSLLNDAYRILKNNILRAEHLLSLHNVDIKTHSFNDLEFLTKQLDYEEKLQDDAKCALGSVKQDFKMYEQDLSIHLKNKEFKLALLNLYKMQMTFKLITKYDNL